MQGALWSMVQAHSSLCKTCDKNMTDMSKESRVCPQPDVIQRYLRENADFLSEISTNDR